MTEFEYTFNGSLEEHGTSALVSKDYVLVESTVTFEGMARSNTALNRIKFDDADLVEVVLDDTTLLMTFAELKACALLEPGRGDTDNPLPSHIAGDRGDRGITGVAIRVLRKLGLNLPAHVIGKAAKRLEDSLDERGSGVYKVAEDGSLLKQALPTDNKQILLLLHGTASSTSGAFASLLPNKQASKKGKVEENDHLWKALYKEFDGRIFALEQKTLTETPVANLLEFLEQWPPEGGPSLVLLSHSRGGIVGDFLSSLRDWESQPKALFDALEDNSTEKEQLLVLQSKVSEISLDQRPRVSRHIRVGTPAAGTSLASEKTHIWLSVLADMTGYIPAVGGSVNALGDIAAAVAKEALEAGTLPGIDAQKPDSPFIKVTQFLKCKQTDLLAVTGDSKGLLKKVLSPIFGEENDLIVNTRSMLLGPQYKNRYQLPIIDKDIIHISYFKHPKLRSNLKNALTGDFSDADFKKLSDSASSSRGHVASAKPTDQVDLPCMFLLPGIMGSELSIGSKGADKDIWLDYLRLALGKGAQLTIGNAAVSTTGVLETGYKSFVDYVRAKNEFHVVPHGYDWRKSIFDSVEELEALIQQRLEVSPNQAIVLVCHSMGGLVARAWRINHRETWDSLVKKGGRMVQLGTPNYGSWTVPRIFLGKEKILSILALADLRNSHTDWLKMISKFPGLLELCDFNSPHLDLSEQTSWRTIGAKVVPTMRNLKDAKASVDALIADGFETDEDIVYVAGVSEKTPALEMTGNTVGLADRIHQGDGRVLWPEEGQKKIDYFMDAIHGDLLNRKSHFDAVIDLAKTGQTNRLSSRKPQAKYKGSTRSSDVSSVRERLELAPEAILFPSISELEAAALGGTDQKSNVIHETDESLTLSVTHGNLMYCKHPVMVGHYIGDGIKRAERSLDAKLDDVLSRRWNLGAEFYAGAVGTHDVAVRFEKTEKKPGPTGAIVVGLGRMGELQKGDLITTVRNGVLKYAQLCAEKEKDCSALKIASLLIGSGQEALELLDVLDAIVDGVMSANKILKQNLPDDEPAVRIAELEFIEWHLDVAIDARHKLENLPSNLSFKPTIKPGLGKTDGGHKRSHLQEDTDWWDSLKVKMKPGKTNASLSTLMFSVLGGKALGISGNVEFNQREIDTFLKPILSNSNEPDPDQVEALFEQLIPPGLKSLAAQRRNLVVNMDPESAYLPWEILIDRKSTNSKPIAVAAGMVRRIISDEAANEYVLSHVVSAEEDAALVVGNPPGGPMFPNLPGAFEEAVQIAQVLKDSDWAVNDKNLFGDTSRVGNIQTAASIRQDIFVKDYRVLHFAAHGVHDGENASNSGVVIGYDEATDCVELFGPHHVRAIRHKPSLVFINCCHAGKVEDWSFHKLSASLAAEFIKSGVHCVIGAGWAVDDAAALGFAKTVYSCLLNGDNFGFAVRRAREFVYERFPETNTWAAFQCYGDPGFLLSRRMSSHKVEQETSFYDISELLCQLENLRSDLSGSKGPGSSGNKSATLKSADALYRKSGIITDDETGQVWSERGDVLTHFAIIYCELNEEDKALEFLKLAAAADSSDVALADLLALENYEARFAERLYCETLKRGGDSAKDKGILSSCRARIKATIESLEKYSKIHKNAAAVHEKLASAYKLFAMTSSDEERNIQIKKMIDEYLEALSLTRSSKYYSASNALLGCALLKASEESIEKKYQDKVPELKEVLKISVAKKGSKNFWDLVAHLDSEFIFSLEKGNFDENIAEKIAKEIADAAVRFGSDGQLDSIAKQFRFVALLSNDPLAAKAAKHAYKIITGDLID